MVDFNKNKTNNHLMKTIQRSFLEHSWKVTSWSPSSANTPFKSWTKPVQVFILRTSYVRHEHDSQPLTQQTSTLTTEQ